MRSKTDQRHAARQLALSSIFSWLFSEQLTEQSLDLSKELLELETEEQELFSHIVEGVKSHLDDIDKTIELSAPEWPLDKISKVDLVILRIAIFEMVYGNKTPTKVAIDEAVELAKEFGNDTSHKFVNGVLGTVAEKHTKK
jgi:N utilization substance protein B